MKVLLALFCSLFIIGSSAAQCVNGVCYGSNYSYSGYFQPVQYQYYLPQTFQQPVVQQPVVQNGANHTHRCGNCGLLFDHSANSDPTQSHFCPNCKTGPWTTIESFTSAPLTTRSVIQPLVTSNIVVLDSSKFNVFGGTTTSVVKDNFNIFGSCPCQCNCGCVNCMCAK